MTTCGPVSDGGVMWPTPTARDHKGPQSAGRRPRYDDDLATRVMRARQPEPPPEDDQELTLFAAGSLASPSPSRARVSRKMTRGGSGRRSRTSFATYDHATSSWKTSRVSLDGEWETYSGTWPASGMTVRGIAYQRPTSVPPIYGSGSGLLPTPSAVSYGTNQGGGAGRTGPVRPSLDTMARHGLFPTPTVGDSRNSRNETAGRSEGSEHHSGVTLSDYVTMWPTPSASLGSHAGLVTPAKGREGGNLVEAVSARMWPTPEASDATGGRVSAEVGGTRPSGTKRAVTLGTAVAHDMVPTPTASRWDGLQSHGTNVVTGQLNPVWVEWLQGFPPGWTDCEE